MTFSLFRHSKLRSELRKIEATAAQLSVSETSSAESLQYLSSLGPNVFTPAELFLEVQKLYQMVLDISRQLGDRGTEAEVLYNIGRLFQNPPRKSIFISERMTERELEAAVDSRAGVVHRLQPEDQQIVLSYFQQALELARKEKRVIIEASCLVNIAVAHRHLGDGGQHRRYVQEAERVAGQVGNPEMQAAIRDALEFEKQFYR